MRKADRAKHWARIALKCGLLATDASVLAALQQFVRDDVGEAPRVTRRSDRMAIEIPTQREWSHVSTLAGGIAIGFGLGMLLAPVSGSRARGAIRNAAVDVRNKASNIADWAGRRRMS